MAEVTPEMIEAGRRAYTQSNGHYAAIYLAMKALDPDVRDLIDALRVARAVVAHHNPHGSANLTAIDRVLERHAPSTPEEQSR